MRKTAERRVREICAVLFSAVLCAVTLTACGASPFSTSSSAKRAAGEYAVAETAAAAAAPARYDGGVQYNTMGVAADAMVADMEMAEEKSAGGSEEMPKVTDGRKLIRNVSISIRLPSDEELQGAVAGITAVTKQFGGFVVNNDMNFDRNYAGGSLTIQVPKDDVDRFLEAIRGQGYRITGINDSSRDVTSQYVDTETRIKVQEQKIENYQKYLEQAENVTDTLEISDRLNEAIADMESYKSTMKALNQQIDYTEIFINLSCDAAVTHESFGERVQRTLRETGENFVDCLLDGLQWFSEAVAGLIFALPLIWIVIRVVMAAFRAGRGAVKGKNATGKDAAGQDGSGKKKGFFGFGRKKQKKDAADTANGADSSGSNSDGSGAAGSPANPSNAEKKD